MHGRGGPKGCRAKARAESTSMGSGLHTTDNAMMREHQQRDLEFHPDRPSEPGMAPCAIGSMRGATIDEIPAIEPGELERLVQPGTDTPRRGLGNVVNGHNRPGENAPAEAVATRRAN